MSKPSVFEIVLLFVGVTASILGFQLINSLYANDSKLTWLMLIAVFQWLTMIVLFILLSLIVDNSKKQNMVLEEISIKLGKQKKKSK